MPASDVVIFVYSIYNDVYRKNFSIMVNDDWITEGLLATDKSCTTLLKSQDRSDVDFFVKNWRNFYLFSYVPNKNGYASFNICEGVFGVDWVYGVGATAWGDDIGRTAWFNDSVSSVLSFWYSFVDATVIFDCYTSERRSGVTGSKPAWLFALLL